MNILSSKYYHREASLSKVVYVTFTSKVFACFLLDGGAKKVYELLSETNPSEGFWLEQRPTASAGLYQWQLDGSSAHTFKGRGNVRY